MTPAEFKAIIPALSGETPDAVNAAIALATPWFNLDRWGAFYSEGLANWVAHTIVTSKPGFAATLAGDGAQTDKQVGSVRVGRSAKLLERQADDPFMTTGYGRRYRYLAKLAGMGAVAA
jgi:Protein of unknown function (DUF4054)